MTTKRILTTLAVLALGVGLTAPKARAACCPTCCEQIVPGVTLGGSHTYHALSTNTGTCAPKLCTTNAASNRFMPCTSDANCGGTSGTCLQTPWLTVGGIPLSFPTGVSVTFTLTENTNTSSCQHTACIACGSNVSPCPGTPGLPANCTAAGVPAQCCTGNHTGNCGCCGSAGFTVPAFFIPTLNFCSRVDQRGCGDGAFNSRNPQQVTNGDNDVTKRADTSDPGADCIYGTADDPAAKPCNTTPGVGAGADQKGKVTRTVGNGAADANGIHARERIPLRSTTWTVASSANCPPTATWAGPTTGAIVSGFNLILDGTTASATGQFQDMNGDGCASAGAGFLGTGVAGTNGPFTVTGVPGPYAGGCSRVVAIGEVMPGAGPLYDLGFVSVTPFAAPTQVATQSCSCSVTPGCPE